MNLRKDHYHTLKKQKNEEKGGVGMQVSANPFFLFSSREPKQFFFLAPLVCYEQWIKKQLFFFLIPQRHLKNDNAE